MKIANEFQLSLRKDMDDMDDRRERRKKASSIGRHEPGSIGLYDINDVDGGGDLIMRVERSAQDAFVPVAELIAEVSVEEEDDLDEVVSYVAPPTKRDDAATLRSTSSPSVLIRRRAL